MIGTFFYSFLCSLLNWFHVLNSRYTVSEDALSEIGPIENNAIIEKNKKNPRLMRALEECVFIVEKLFGSSVKQAASPPSNSFNVHSSKRKSTERLDTLLQSNGMFSSKSPLKPCGALIATRFNFQKIHGSTGVIKKM